MYVLLGIIAGLLGVLVIVTWYTSKRLVGMPGVSQLLPLSPFRIPLLADKMYIFGVPNGASRDLLKSTKDGIARITTFNSNTVFVSNLEVVKDIMLKKSDNFYKPTEFYDYISLFGDNLLNTNDSEWRKHRVVADPAFAEQNYTYLIQKSAEATDMLIERLQAQHESKGRTIIDPFDEIQDATLDVIGKVAFGYDFGIFKPKPIPKGFQMSFLDAIKTTLTWGIGVNLTTPNFLKKYLFPKTTLAVAETKQYMNQLIQDRRNDMDAVKYDLLSMLVDSNLSREGGLSDAEIMSDVFIFLIAGHETSSVTLQWLLYHLCVHPECQDKLYEEIKKVCAVDGTFTMSQYEDLHYLRACIQETLRLNPPVVGIPKKCRAATKIGPYVVPAGTDFVVDVDHIQTSEQNWKNPTTFNPDRFDSRSSDYVKKHPCSLLPFSLGQRKCIGFRFSEIEMAVMMSKFVLYYKFSLPKDDPLMQTKQVLKGDITKWQQVTCKPYYLRVEFTKR
ncbi:cytochrome P450 [Acrasis kona]|uniref:Cytochrome P450 n=1 Tax=Acrasis kona TaxID=1008807 RepID=A0AAW2Z5G8_9EUKA